MARDGWEIRVRARRLPRCRRKRRSSQVKGEAREAEGEASSPGEPDASTRTTRPDGQEREESGQASER